MPLEGKNAVIYGAGGSVSGAVAEVANVATLMSSDSASAMTGVIANVTCGYIVD